MERENKFALKFKEVKSRYLPLAVPDLSLDTSFAEGGCMKFSIDSHPAERMGAVLSYPRGGAERYVATYHNSVPRGSPRAGCTLFDDKGNVDRSFGDRGHVFFQLEANRTTIPISSFIDAQDYLVVYADSIEEVSDTFYQHSYLIKINPYGIPDESFGDKGQLNLDTLVAAHFPRFYEQYDDAYCVSAFPDPHGGYYLSARLLKPGGPDTDNLIVRLDAKGKIDMSFGVNGGVIIQRNGTDPSRLGLTYLAVHEGRLVASFLTSAANGLSVLHAYTLEGERDLDYGKKGEVRLGIVSRVIGSLSDDTLAVMGHGYEGMDQLAALSTVDKSGTIIKHFEMLGAGMRDPGWGSASLVGNRIYCAGRDYYLNSVVGCYSADTLELDKSFNEVGYGKLPAGAEASVGATSVVLPKDSLLIAGAYQRQAAVFAVKTKS